MDAEGVGEGYNMPGAADLRVEFSIVPRDADAGCPFPRSLLPPGTIVGGRGIG